MQGLILIKILEIILILSIAILWVLLNVMIAVLIAEYIVPYIQRKWNVYKFQQCRKRNAYIGQLWSDIEKILQVNKELSDLLNEQKKDYPLFYWQYKTKKEKL